MKSAPQLLSLGTVVQMRYEPHKNLTGRVYGRTIEEISKYDIELETKERLRNVDPCRFNVVAQQKELEQ